MSDYEKLEWIHHAIQRCRQQGDYIAVATANKSGTYNLCLNHWVAVSKTDGSIQQQLTKVAIPSKHGEQT